MRTTIAGISIDQLTFQQAMQIIIALSTEQSAKYVVTANPEMIVAAQTNETFKAAINAADVVVADGIGLLPAAEFLQRNPKRFRMLRLLYAYGSILLPMHQFTVLPERVSGADLTIALAKTAAKTGEAVFFLGGANVEAADALAHLQKQLPNLQGASDAGSPNVLLETEAEFSDIKQKLASGEYRYVFVAYGHPKQEIWIAQHQAELPHAVYIGVGGTFAYLAGTKRRAHPFLQKIGLEWFWRLILEPRRIGRIYTAVVRFPLVVLRNETKHA